MEEYQQEPCLRCEKRNSCLNKGPECPRYSSTAIFSIPHYVKFDERPFVWRVSTPRHPLVRGRPFLSTRCNEQIPWPDKPAKSIKNDNPLLYHYLTWNILEGKRFLFKPYCCSNCLDYIKSMIQKISRQLPANIDLSDILPGLQIWNEQTRPVTGAHKEVCIHGFPVWKCAECNSFSICPKANLLSPSQSCTCAACDSLKSSQFEIRRLYWNRYELNFNCKDPCESESPLIDRWKHHDERIDENEWNRRLKENGFDQAIYRFRCPFYNRCSDEDRKRGYALLLHLGFYKRKRGNGKTNWTQELRRMGFRAYGDYKLQFEAFVDPIFTYRFLVFLFNLIKHKYNIFPFQQGKEKRYYVGYTLEERIAKRISFHSLAVQRVYENHLGEGWPEEKIWEIDYKSGGETSKVRYSIELSNVFPSLGLISRQKTEDVIINGAVYYRTEKNLNDLGRTIRTCAEERRWKCPSEIKSVVFFSDKNLIDPIKEWAEAGRCETAIAVTDGKQSWTVELTKNKVYLDARLLGPYWAGKWEKPTLARYEDPETKETRIGIINETPCVVPMWAFALYELGTRTNSVRDNTRGPIGRPNDSLLDRKDIELSTGIPLELEDKIRYSYGVPDELKLKHGKVIKRIPLYKIQPGQILPKEVKKLNPKEKTKIIYIMVQDPGSSLKYGPFGDGWNWLFKPIEPITKPALKKYRLLPNELELQYKKDIQAKSKEIIPDYDNPEIQHSLYVEHKAWYNATKPRPSGLSFEEGELIREDGLDFDEREEDAEPSQDVKEDQYQYFTVEDFELWTEGTDPGDQPQIHRKELKPYHFRNELEEKTIEWLDYDELTPKDKIGFLWFEYPEVEDTELANFVGCSSAYVCQVKADFKAFWILKYYAESKLKKEKNEMARILGQGEERMGPRQKKYLMGGIGARKPEKMTIQPEVKAYVESLSITEKKSVQEILELLTVSDVKMKRFQKHFPYVGVKIVDIDRFAENLLNYLKASSARESQLRKKLREQESELNILRGVIPKKRLGMIYKAIELNRSKRGRGIWEPTGEKYVVEVPVRDKETRAEYQKRIKDNKSKWIK